MSSLDKSSQVRVDMSILMEIVFKTVLSTFLLRNTTLQHWLYFLPLKAKQR